MTKKAKKISKSVLVPLVSQDTEENKRTKILYAIKVARMLRKDLHILHFGVKKRDKQEVENSLKLFCSNLGIEEEEVKIISVIHGVRSSTINSVCKKIHAGCVVMGADKLHNKMLMFWYTDGNFDLINSLNSKVFVVPSGMVFSPPKKIVIAFDNGFQIQKLTFTVALAKANKSKITIFCENNPHAHRKSEIRLDYIKKYISDHDLSYTVEIARNRDKSYAHHLMKYAVKNGDLLVLEHDDKGIYKKTKKYIEEILFSKKFVVLFVRQQTLGRLASFNG